MHVHIDPLGGMAGDMFLAAAIDAGIIDRRALEKALQALGVGPVGIATEEVRRKGLTATHVHFEGWDEEEEKDHRHLSTIVDMLEASPLPDAVARCAITMFERLGRVEADIHGVTMDEVHFHECGALDSIFDFVSAAWIMTRTEATWSVAPLSTGQGTIETDHGTLPVPAPATADLIEGLDLAPRAVNAELVTPTGATILRTLRESGRLTTRPAGRVRRTGYGAGTRDFDAIANVVRFIVLDTAGDPEGDTEDRVVRLACEVDDMSPEVLAYVEERLLEAGALDVGREPVLMKKGRQGTRLSVLCQPADRDVMADLIFRETSTFGLRVASVQRLKLARHRSEVETPFGPVTVKVGRWKGVVVKAVPEYDDCARLAAAADVPLRKVYEAARQAAHHSITGDTYHDRVDGDEK